MGFSRKEYWSGLPLPSLSQKGAVCQSFPLRMHLRNWLGWGGPVEGSGWEGGGVLFHLLVHRLREL